MVAFGNQNEASGTCNRLRAEALRVFSGISGGHDHPSKPSAIHCNTVWFRGWNSKLQGHLNQSPPKPQVWMTFLLCGLLTLPTHHGSHLHSLGCNKTGQGCKGLETAWYWMCSWLMSFLQASTGNLKNNKKNKQRKANPTQKKVWKKCDKKSNSKKKC